MVAGVEEHGSQPVFYSSQKKCNVDPVQEDCFLQPGAITALSSIHLLNTSRLYALFWAKSGALPPQVLPQLQDLAWQFALSAMVKVVQQPGPESMAVFHAEAVACIARNANKDTHKLNVVATFVTTADVMSTTYSTGNVYIGHFLSSMMRPMISAALYDVFYPSDRQMVNSVCPSTGGDGHHTDQDMTLVNDRMECLHNYLMTKLIPDIFVIILLDETVT